MPAAEGPAALGALTWPECGPGPVRDPIATDGPMLLVPTGAVEQHGPHLPLGTDTLVAAAVARRVADTFTAGTTLVAPPVWFGASGEHEGFPGTVSIGREALTSLLIELGRSACRWARGVVFVNGHGGNAMALVAAVNRLRYEGRRAAWVPCAAGGDAHAGRTETSLVLALAPELARVERAEAGNTSPVRDLLADLRREGVLGVSPNGVLGDPAGASAEHGQALLAALVLRVAAQVRSFQVDTDGRLRPGQEVA